MKRKLNLKNLCGAIGGVLLVAGVILLLVSSASGNVNMGLFYIGIALISPLLLYMLIALIIRGGEALYNGIYPLQEDKDD